MYVVVRLLAVLLLYTPAAMAAQQQGSVTHLSLALDAKGMSGEWRVLIADLGVPGLDRDGNGTATWPEVEHRQEDIETHLRDSLQVVANGGLAGVRFEQLLYGLQRGRPAILANMVFDAQADITQLDIDMGAYGGELLIRWPDGAYHRRELAAGGGAHQFAHATAMRGSFLEMLRQGIWHIWIGLDHILFLLVLLLPAVFRGTPTGREAVPGFGAALAQVLLIVSCFTVAHSITLTCAAMGWITLPGRLVESAIAASVVLAALSNFLPRATGGRGAWLAFAFGLLHGFGFASVLGEIVPAAGPLWQTLLAFNVGVEVGQMAIVAAFLPLAFLLRRTAFYRLGVLYGGSALVAAVALYWLVQRSLAG